MKKILYYVSIFVVSVAVVCASMGIRPNIGFYDFQIASQHIENASPTGNSSLLSYSATFLDATQDAWEIWEIYSSQGEYQVRVTFGDKPETVKDGVPIYRGEVERREVGNPLSPWRRIAWREIAIETGTDIKAIRRIYDAMGEGLFGLSINSPSAVASNIAITMAEETATAQLNVWRAVFDSILYIAGLKDAL